MAPPSLVVDLAAAGDQAGGKAAGLARLCAAGLPVPPGFAVTGAGFAAVTGAAPGALALDDVGATLAAWAAAADAAAVPPALEAEVVARARALGGPLAVRSSMAIEDGAVAAAPGLGQTVLGVAPDDVWTAIRAVWAASLTPLIAAYARGAAARPPGVIVQREVAGARVVVFTRPPGRRVADEVWVDAAGALIRTARDPATAPPALAGAVQLALAAEAAIGAGDGTDVELIETRGDGGWAIVQARPLVHPPPRPARQPAPPLVLAPLRNPARAWVRDVTHNPDPLSPAQAGLCERVERAAIAPFHLAVVAGYLYTAPRDGVAAPPPPADAAAFEARFAAAAAEVERVLADAGDDLPGALAAYLAAYRVLMAEIAPLVAAGRRALVDALIAGGASPRAAAARAAALAPRRPSSVAAALADAAAGRIDRAALLARIGDVALTWDVAAPTFAEQPALVDDAIARARARPAPPPEPPPPPELAAEVALARAAADAAERDDLLFARAQAVVRRALLAVAARAGLSPDDVCWLPLDELADGHLPDPIRATARAAAARAAAARAATWELPLTVGGPPAPAATGAWTGVGLGGRVAGPVAVIAQLADAARIPARAIVVARAITPALALVVEGAAALVCEHGSLLDHGAAMARELAIPCVIGCAGIVDAVVDGDWLEVDGDGGRVTRLVADGG